jgi:hypothetical protein
MLHRYVGDYMDDGIITWYKFHSTNMTGCFSR